jgi:hypothetical protein
MTLMFPDLKFALYRQYYQDEGDRLAVWDAIDEALSTGLPLPAWTTDYLRELAACLFARRHRYRPASRQIASAIASAVLDPHGELDRMRFEDARRALKQKRLEFQQAPTSARPALQQDIRSLERVIASERPRVAPRRTGRNANPFAADDRKRHEIMLAMDVWMVLGDEWKRDHAAGPAPTLAVYRNAARRHRTQCDVCRKEPSWKATQRAWLAHRETVIPLTVRAKRAALNHTPRKSHKV